MFHLFPYLFQIDLTLQKMFFCPKYLLLIQMSWNWKGFDSVILSIRLFIPMFWRFLFPHTFIFTKRYVCQFRPAWRTFSPTILRLAIDCLISIGKDYFFSCRTLLERLYSVNRFTLYALRCILTFKSIYYLGID